MSYFYNDELEDVYTYDVDKAKELMAEAGYEDGFDITITVPSNYQKHIDYCSGNRTAVKADQCQRNY